jgi:hypothetical protein
MFKNRAITVTVDKSHKDQNQETPKDPQDFEKKAEFVLNKLGVVGTKVFAGVCIYVLLDTHRKVAIMKAMYPR